MPAENIHQQRLMAQAYQVKKGAIKPEEIESEYRDQIVDLANSMTLKQLKDFAETKHSEMKNESTETVNEWLPGVSAGHKWYTQSAQSASAYGGHIKNHSDSLIKSFMEFIESGKKPADDEEETRPHLAEDAAPTAHSAPLATPANTPGMGNVAPPGPGKIGSGDKFGEDDEEDIDM